MTMKDVVEFEDYLHNNLLDYTYVPYNNMLNEIINKTILR